MPVAAALRTADFERLLSARPLSRSEHFVLHHLPAPELAAGDELSTSAACGPALLVDGRRFGLVVPKRHARRAVTRTLIKRQGRAQFFAHAAELPVGDWLLRLRAVYAPARYRSAASDALKCAVRDELQSLFSRAAGAKAASASR